MERGQPQWTATHVQLQTTRPCRFLGVMCLSITSEWSAAGLDDCESCGRCRQCDVSISMTIHFNATNLGMTFGSCHESISCSCCSQLSAMPLREQVVHNRQAAGNACDQGTYSPKQVHCLNTLLYMAATGTSTYMSAVPKQPAPV